MRFLEPVCGAQSLKEIRFESILSGTTLNWSNEVLDTRLGGNGLNPVTLSRQNFAGRFDTFDANLLFRVTTRGFLSCASGAEWEIECRTCVELFNISARSRCRGRRPPPCRHTWYARWGVSLLRRHFAFEAGSPPTAPSVRHPPPRLSVQKRIFVFTSTTTTTTTGTGSFDFVDQQRS